MKDTTVNILLENDFDKDEFKDQCKKGYSRERDYIDYGKPSAMVNVEKEDQHLDRIGKVGSWTFPFLLFKTTINQHIVFLYDHFPYILLIIKIL